MHLKNQNPTDGFVSSSLRFLRGFAEAPWFDGGHKALLGVVIALEVYEKYDLREVRPTLLGGESFGRLKA